MAIKRRKNPDYGFVGLAITAVAVTGATIKRAVEGQQKKKTDAAQKVQKTAEQLQEIEENKLKTKQSAARQAKNNAQSSILELEQREKLHSEMVAQEQSTTSYVDQYRQQVGITDDSMLNNLWKNERAIAEETLELALKQEEEELGEQPINFTKIALYSVLGIAGIGALVYSKKKFK